MESHKRSIAKAASYRFFGSLITGGIVYAFSGQWDVALGVGVFDATAKMGAPHLIRAQRRSCRK